MSPYTFLLAAVLSIGLTAIQARSVSHGHGRSLLSVTTALIGYQQDVYLKYEGADPSGECSLSGIPGPDGYSGAGPSPVLFTTPKGTGVHIVATTLPEGWYSTVALLSAPPSESYSVGAADPLNPTLVFDASKASEGESGIGALVVYDPAGTYICKSTISFQVTAPLACLPTSTGPVIPQPTGNTVYLDSSVSSTVIQQITVVNSVNIVNIQNVVNINQVSCNCCYNSCNNNVLFLLLNVTVNNNNNTAPPSPKIPTQAPPPRVPPPVYPPSSGGPPSPNPVDPPRSSTPPPRSVPPPVTGGPPTTPATPPPRPSTTPSSPPPASLQAPPSPGGNRTTTTTTSNLTPPAGRK